MLNRCFKVDVVDRVVRVFVDVVFVKVDDDGGVVGGFF